LVDAKTTKIIEDVFSNAGLDLEEFRNLFAGWKSLGPKGEDDVYEFGKDVPYEKPHVNGQKNVLMHVHLVPIVDIEKKEKWDKSWERYSRRTSNRSLVYVNDGGKKFLLIDIIPEPDAHEIPKMLTQQHKEIMEFYAEIADKFIYSGIIIA
jgi:mRNA interferase YafO